MADGEVLGDARELRQMLADCAPYLKEGETPAQRIERERRDTDAALSLLIREKNLTQQLREQLAATPAPAEPLTGCNCRWNGDEQVQWCELHAAHKEAIHDWAERAKTAEAKLAATKAEAKPLTEQEVAEAVFDYYQHFSDPQDAAEACFDKDLAMFRLAERACAEAWGVKLAGIGASSEGDKQ